MTTTDPTQRPPEGPHDLLDVLRFIVRARSPLIKAADEKDLLTLRGYAINQYDREALTQTIEALDNAEKQCLQVVTSAIIAQQREDGPLP